MSQNTEMMQSFIALYKDDIDKRMFLNLTFCLLNPNYWLMAYQMQDSDDYLLEFPDGWLGWSPGMLSEVTKDIDDVLKDTRITPLQKMWVIKVVHTKLLKHIAEGIWK